MTKKPTGKRAATLVADWAVEETTMRAQLGAMQWGHYVYALCDEAGAAFYIGKGRGDRLFQHSKDAATGRAGAKYEQIRALGAGLRYAILLACKDDPYALGFEALLIRQHFPCLTNETNGSETAIARMNKPFFDDSPLGMLLATLMMGAEMLRDIDMAAARLVAEHPHMRATLFPEDVACPQ